jgi:CheY-like chemotaxis protein
VDDEADMRLTVKLSLELAGYAVEVAANGREALEVQRMRPADVLITDIFMPDADGFEAIDSFRSEFPHTRSWWCPAARSSASATTCPTRR